MNWQGQILRTDLKHEPQPKVSDRSAWALQRSLLIIMVVAILLRVISSFAQGETVQPLPGVFDQISYDELARRVVDGHGFSFATEHWPATRAGEPTAHWSYLYTVYLAAIYAVVGVHPLAARLIQAVISGILHSWLSWRLGRRLFGPRVGLVAAALSAVYIYFFYYAGSLITEPFYLVSILWTFDVAFRLATVLQVRHQPNASQSRQWRLWLELGLAIGVTALLRQLFLLFVPFLYGWLGWIWLRANRPAIKAPQPKPQAGWQPLQGFVVATCMIGLLIAPWTLRNYWAFGTFVPLNTNAGYAFFWGNHPIYGTHFVGILPDDGPSYLDLIPKELRPLNEAALDRALLQRGIGFITADPQRYILLSISRLNEYFKFWPSADSGMISNLARVGSFGLYLPFMLLGLGLSIRRYWRSDDPQQRADLILLYLFMFVYTAIHLLSWALIRYRLPVDLFLILFAALGLVDLVNRYRLRGQPVQP
ncbi:MAG: glycosyltransferase family 39 protein [Chloroflexi bacterium]|nr:glycosyltransferase family 39 protein [Chloroflexota bacterium]